VKLLLVDACRNDPKLGRNADPDALPRPPRGTAALFSCKGGERAFETDKLGARGHGVFFHFVLEGLRGKARNEDGEVTWGALSEYVSRNVGRTVPRLIGGGARQTPHEIKNLEGESPVLVASPGSAPPEKGGEKPSKEKVVKELKKELLNGIDMKLVLVPAGTFRMGSPSSEAGRYDDEQPHTVKITRPFYMGACMVTQEQYERVMGDNPSSFASTGGGKAKVKDESTHSFPVESVSWHDANRFCTKLSAMAEEMKASRVYRLPTEAEWEYACRAGTTTAFHFGRSLSSSYANINLGRTCPVGRYKPNGFGLFDMHGNVWQWCADWYAEDFYRKSPEADPTGPRGGERRVVRGGSWYDDMRDVRAAVRGRQPPDYRGDHIGFRVVFVPGEPR
jgi:formylglycine-generating enzyme required for sulfatase activity